MATLETLSKEEIMTLAYARGASTGYTRGLEQRDRLIGERFPGLRVAFLEGNCSWAPFWIWRMDEHWEHREQMVKERLPLRPSEYFKRQCYVSIEADEEPGKYALDWLGDDNVVFSTDYPHPDSRYPPRDRHGSHATHPEGEHAQGTVGQLRPALRAGVTATVSSLPRAGAPRSGVSFRRPSRSGAAVSVGRIRSGAPVAYIIPVAAVEPVIARPTAAAKYTLRSLARRYRQLGNEIQDLEAEIQRLTRTTAPALVDSFGIGPDTAATLLIAAGSNPDRLHSEAAFASLCGANPIPASSGKTNRHRLNRGGHRHANAALRRIVIVRLRYDQRTQAYMRRRTTEGISKAEVIRCLKRYIAREVFSALRNSAPSQSIP